MKLTKYVLTVVLLLLFIYAIGPRHRPPVYDNAPLHNRIAVHAIQDSLEILNKAVTNLKPANEAEIVWAYDSSQITEFCFVYLPGFGASKGEAEPLHRQLAKRYQQNLFLARLEKQGIIEAEPFIELSEKKLVESAKEAVRFGKSLGKKVIILSTSTGATLGLYLAAKDPDIAAVVAWSANIDMADPMSAMLTLPWGLQLARLSMGSKYRSFAADSTIQKWWIHRYRIEGLVSLKSLLQQTMTNTVFKQINQPVLMAYYYKNDTIKDNIISIEKGKAAFEALASPADKKELHLLDNVSGHCMASQYYANPQQLDTLRLLTEQFLEKNLHLKTAKLDTVSI